MVLSAGYLDWEYSFAAHSILGACAVRLLAASQVGGRKSKQQAHRQWFPAESDQIGDFLCVPGVCALTGALQPQQQKEAFREGLCLVASSPAEPNLASSHLSREGEMPGTGGIRGPRANTQYTGYAIGAMSSVIGASPRDIWPDTWLLALKKG